jgi:hypothetical protein
MARPRTNLVGQRFGRWTVTAPFYFDNGTRYAGRWVVKCDCGNTEDRSGHQLQSGKSTQCLPCTHQASRERVAKQRKAMKPITDLRAEMFDLLKAVKDGKVDPKEARARVKQANKDLRRKGPKR